MRTLLTLGVVALSACAPDGTSPNAVPTASPALAKNAGDTPVLLARAILPSDAYQPGPISGTLITPDNGVTLPFPGQPVPASPRSSMPATARSGRCPTTATPRRTTRLTRWPKSTVRCDGTTEIPAGSTSTSEPARRSPSSGSTSSRGRAERDPGTV